MSPLTDVVIFEAMFSRGCCLALVLAGCGTFGAAASSAETDAAATGPDGGMVLDASTASTVPCPPNALFCDAFDTRAAVQGGWDTTTTVHGATLVLDPVLFKGAPSSLHATATSAGQMGDGHLEKTLQDVTSTVHVHFAFRVVSLVGVGYARIFAGTADSRDFEIAVGEAGFQVHTADTNGNLNFEPVGQPPAAGVWHDIDYTLAFKAKGSVTFKLDGTMIYSKGLSLGSFNPPAMLNLRLGVTTETDVIDVHYDDFSIVPE